MPRQQRVRRMAAAIGLACASAVAQCQTASHPFQNPALPAGQRIANILSLMTVGEKIDMLSTDTTGTGTAAWRPTR